MICFNELQFDNLENYNLSPGADDLFQVMVECFFNRKLLSTVHYQRNQTYKLGSHEQFLY